MIDKDDSMTKHRMAYRDLDFLIRSTQPLISICTHEESRIIDTIRTICNMPSRQWDLVTWDIANGIKCLTKNPDEPKEKLMNQQQVLQWFDEQQPSEDGKYLILVLKDFHHFIPSGDTASQSDFETIRQLRNISQDNIKKFKTIIILSPSIEIPQELEKLTAVVDWPLPERTHITERVKNLLQIAKATPELVTKGFKTDYTDNEIDELVSSFQGLSLLEIELLCAYNILTATELDPLFIASKKRDVIRKSGVLEWIDTENNLNDVGGLREMKRWLEKRKKAFSEEAKEYGLPENPKGVLLVGVQGAGKSLMSQAVAKFWHLPLLRLDMGKVFSGIVGSSEENIRGVIKVAESVAPCLTKDTLITLFDGSEKTIESLYNSNINNLPIISMSSNFKLVKDKALTITKRFYNGYMYGVNTNYGCITTTDNHLHPILKDGQLNWIRADELRVGDNIAVPQKIPTRNMPRYTIDYLPDNTRIYYDGAYNNLPKNLKTPWRKYRKIHSNIDYIKKKNVNNKIINKINKYTYGNGGYTDSSLTKLPEIIDHDLGNLIGLIDSDGCIYKKRISFINTELSLHKKFSELIFKLFGLTTQIIENKCKNNSNLKGLSINPIFKTVYTTYVDNKLLSLLLNNIKSDILIFSQDTLSGWLKGYFDGDGYVADIQKTHVPKIILTSKKNNMNYILRSILRRLGFITTYQNKQIYNVEITGIDNVVKFITEIGLDHPRRYSKMNDWLTYVPNQIKDRTDVIPIGGLLKNARQKSNMSTIDFNMSCSLISCYERNKIYPNRKKLDYILNINKSKNNYWQQIEQLVKSDIMWVPIVDIKKHQTNEYVYDLVCEKNHNFIANNHITHNCVIWLDEVDKGLSGIASSNNTDGGTAARVFGTLLTWMQEKQAPVYMVATANDISQLPPELLRKGRFDEIFFVDLPTDEDRKDIFKIHLEKRHRDPSKFDLSKLVKISTAYTGAEIEQGIIDAMYEAFSDQGREVTDEDIYEELKNMIPLSVTMKESIENLRKWAKTRARNASVLRERNDHKEIEEQKKLIMQINEEEL